MRGHPRGYEDPEEKAKDWRSAITFVQTLPYVDADRIAGIGICGSGVYLPNAVKDDQRMKAVVSIVPFTIMNYVVTGTDEELLRQNAASEVKELQVIAEATHFDMYDLEEYVTQNLQHIERFLKANL